MQHKVSDRILTAALIFSEVESSYIFNLDRRLWHERG
jgi:hypothetical protein